QVGLVLVGGQRAVLVGVGGVEVAGQGIDRGGLGLAQRAIAVGVKLRPGDLAGLFRLGCGGGRILRRRRVLCECQRRGGQGKGGEGKGGETHGKEMTLHRYFSVVLWVRSSPRRQVGVFRLNEKSNAGIKRTLF